MMDVYDKIEGYCNLLIERVHLIEQERCFFFYLFNEILSLGFLIEFMGLVVVVQRMSWGTKGGNRRITLCSFKMWRISRASGDSWGFDFSLWERVRCSCHWITQQLRRPSSGITFNSAARSIILILNFDPSLILF